MKGKATNLQRLMLVVLLQPLVVEAHPFHWAAESLGFVGGLIHPITGSDHILTMLAVGLWMSQVRSRLAYFMPLGFVFFMLMGCGLTLIPIEIAHAEAIMALSVVTLGGLLVLGNKVSLSLGTLIVAIVAVFHGYVHAYDMWLDANAVSYTAGFAVATLALVSAGVVVRSLLELLALKYTQGRPAER